MVRKFSLEEIEESRKKIRINEFLDASGTSRLNIDPKYFPELLRDLSKTDEYATRDQYLETINDLEKWIGSQRKQLGTWIGISGSWRTMNQAVVDDTAQIVRESLNRGYGIYAGGAAGPDYIATKIMIEEGNPNKQLRLILPAKTSVCMNRYGDVVDNPDPIMCPSQASKLSEQLHYLKKRFPECIYEIDQFNEDDFLNPLNDGFRKHTYLFRNNFIAMGSDGLAAFKVNNSPGVEDIVETVSIMGKPVYQGGLNGQGYHIGPDSLEVINNYDELIVPSLKTKPIINRRGHIYKSVELN